MTRRHPAEPIFMHPAIFIPSWMLLGELIALQEWMNVSRWGYHIPAAIVFKSWGVEFSIVGILSWLIWRFLQPFIVKASVADILLRAVPLGVAFGIIKELIWALFSQNLPLDLAPMPYWTRFVFNWKAEFIDSTIIFWCAFFLFRGIGYYQRYREKDRAAAQLETQLANAKLAALRMQLNPHFLFNAMNSISSLMRTDVDAADSMLEQLSSLLRISLERGNVQLIPLREEMEFIEVYLSMQDQRYAGRVRRDISIDSELHDALVPAMFLQPLVENAYAHGLSKIEKDGELLIEAHRKADKVSFSIMNSGLGLKFAAGSLGNGHVNSASNGHGVGLANVRSRLRLHYGHDCSFEMKQIDQSHVKVSIDFPFQLSDEAQGSITRYGAE
jgi:hypothetical protein